MKYVKNASLLVIGHGTLEGKLTEMGKQILGKRFMLKTGVTHTMLTGYYKAANIFSLPSAQSEAFGIVYVEALAAGLPVVAPRDENRQAIVGSAGLLVEVEDSQKYAEAITSALKKDFGKLPVLQAQQFSWNTIAAQYEKLLIDL